MTNPEYWQQALSQGTLEPLDCDLRSEHAGHESVVRNFAEFSDRLVAICERENHDVATVLVCAFSIVLSKFTGSHDFPMRVRGEAGAIVPLRFVVDRSVSFSKYVRQASERLAELELNEHEADARDVRSSESTWPIFWHGEGFNDVSNGSLAVHVRDGLVIECAAATSPERKYILERVLDVQASILHQVLKDWDVSLECLQVVCGADRLKLLLEFNSTETPFQSRTIQEIFEHEAEDSPDRLAVHDGRISLTYGQLNRRANQLARRLRKWGVQRNEICGILVPRSVHWCVALLGILKSGGAFLPLDPTFPRDRVRFMMKDSGCRLVVGLGALLLGDDITVVDADNDDLETESDANLECVNSVDDLAYVIYTSGTTGVPKGALLCHEGIASFCQHYKNSFQFSHDDRVLNFFSPSFDGSISEMTMSLLAGNSFYILPDEVKASHRLFEEYLNEHQITVATIPPPFLSYLDPMAFPALHTIFVAGSESTKKLLDKWTDRLAVVNHYGPTEVTICATEWKAPRGPVPNPIVPIGRPIANKKAYIVNSDGDLQPLGIRGELCISGVRLSRGYLNRPDLTDEKFVPNPFATELPESDRDRHKTYYRTGDWARWLPDGNIEFLGRIDNQVKIRGFRVELGEVEQAILGTIGVTESAVITKKDETGESVLYGFFTGSASEDEVRVSISTSLPDYMVPSRFTKLEMMPLTRSDKVDKKWLDTYLSQSPEPTASDPLPNIPQNDAVAESVLEFIAASSGGAVITVSNWSDNLEHFGINSLSFIKLMLKIEERFGLEFEGEFFIARKELTVGAVVRETQQRLVRQ